MYAIADFGSTLTLKWHQTKDVEAKYSRINRPHWMCQRTYGSYPSDSDHPLSLSIYLQTLSDFNKIIGFCLAHQHAQF